MAIGDTFEADDVSRLLQDACAAFTDDDEIYDAVQTLADDEGFTAELAKRLNSRVGG